MHPLTATTRRTALGVGSLLAGLALAPWSLAGAAVAAAAAAVTTRSLREEVPWPIGVAIDQRETTGASAALLLQQFSQVTAENAMKPDAVQPTEGRFTFAAADRLVDFARDNGLTVHGHTLVWHQQTPAWFFLDPATGQPLATDAAGRALLLERLRAHITAVADHYRQRYGAYGSAGNPVVAFDVVNEVIDDEPRDDDMRRSEWYRILGPTFVDSAFRYADQAFNGTDPSRPVTLFVNDYGTEWPGKRAAMVRLLRRLLAAGVPVDGVGNQLHLDTRTPVGEIAATLQAFAALGVEQAVTELDVGVVGGVNPASLAVQGAYYRSLGEVLARHPELSCVSIWGLHDGRTWRAGVAPLLFDETLAPKPAFDGFLASAGLQALTPGRVTVTGVPQVGSTLVAQVGAWSPSSATLALQWWAGGRPVPGATGADLVLAAAQSGLDVHVEVTGSAPRHRPTTVASAPVRVAAATEPAPPPVVPGPAEVAPPTVLASPLLRGAPAPGRVLRLVLPALPAGATRTVSWTASRTRRGRGRPLPGGGSLRLRLRREQTGRWVRARVTTVVAGTTTVQTTRPVRVRG